MGRLVFIPSYGTDSSLYDQIRSSGKLDRDCLFTEWLESRNEETISAYAERFIERYQIKNSDFLVGTSLGGVLAIEIQKILPVAKLIVISTIKTSEEKPVLFRILRRSKSYRLFYPQVLKFGLDLIIPLYGRKVKNYLWFRRVFKNSDNQFLRWALKEIVNWENDVIPGNLIHIHGSKDPLFPLKNAKSPHYIVHGGSHAMIRFKAERIAEIINKEVS